MLRTVISLLYLLSILLPLLLHSCLVLLFFLENYHFSTYSHFNIYPFAGIRNQHDPSSSQTFWQDNIDPDNMTYEELLDLGEAVGTHSRGLSQEHISQLPISKFKCGFFSRKKSRGERCVICQMEYKRGDRQITLPCKHVYHAGCGARWLSINKACPICYREVCGNKESRH
uniref:RING-type domain-containing protein n=1 Tax=Nelumbo nucifera TaxID=4432 RepID=A0A822YB83_NELNU|nr:TPA_asm: hypothetical protein HUJ06_031298 [Nelumbo nucifera]